MKIKLGAVAQFYPILPNFGEHQKPLGSLSVRCSPLVESVTCLLSIETTSVDASSVSPIDTIYVCSPVVV